MAFWTIFALEPLKRNKREKDAHRKREAVFWVHTANGNREVVAPRKREPEKVKPLKREF